MAETEAAKPSTYKFPREGAILRPTSTARMARQRHTRSATQGEPPEQRRRTRAEGEGELEAGARSPVLPFPEGRVPGFAQSAIVEIAPQVIRETRRIEGLCAGRRGHPVERALRHHRHQMPGRWRCRRRIEWAFPLDANSAYNHLPWRMLVPQAVDSLLVAGRCASMTRTRPVGRACEQRLLPCRDGGRHGGGDARPVAISPESTCRRCRTSCAPTVCRPRRPGCARPEVLLNADDFGRSARRAGAGGRLHFGLGQLGERRPWLAPCCSPCLHRRHRISTASSPSI